MQSLLSIQRKFSTQKKCIAYLEKIRWGKHPISPYTGSQNVTKRKGTMYYHCNDTNKDFTVIYDTIFEDTRLPLPKWMLLIGMMLNAKMGISSSEIARNLEISYKTAWYCQMRVRCAMIQPDMKLSGLVEMDETYIKAKRKSKNKQLNTPNLSQLSSKRGRGTPQASVVGIVEKNGQVTTKVINKLSTRNLLSMLKRYVKMDDSTVITDGFRAYKKLDDHVEHIMLTHEQQRKRKGALNTNTIEGFFSIIKKGLKGNYVSISRKYLPFYLVEFQYKYNLRHEEKDAFEKLLKRAVNTDKEFNNFKPAKPIKAIIEKRPKKKEVKNAVYKKRKPLKHLKNREKVKTKLTTKKNKRTPNKNKATAK